MPIDITADAPIGVGGEARQRGCSITDALVCRIRTGRTTLPSFPVAGPRPVDTVSSHVPEAGSRIGGAPPEIRTQNLR